jgi:hypothetical protein
MYYIRKSSSKWAVHNNFTGRSRALNDDEIQLIISEFPVLRNGLSSNGSMTYFRNRIKSIVDLP